MNLKRAVWVGLLTYIVSFIFGVLVMIFMGVDATRADEIPNSVFLIGIVVSIVVAVFFTLVYLRGKGIKASAREGFYFGIVLIIIGFLLDVVMFSLGTFFGGSEIGIVEYYSNYLFWISLALFVITTTIVGWIKGRR